MSATDRHPGIEYLVSGATLDGESIGPAFAPAADAHAIARTALVRAGGTVRILREADGCWLEIARYSDTGPRAQPTFVIVVDKVLDDAGEPVAHEVGVLRRGQRQQ